MWPIIAVLTYKYWLQIMDYNWTGNKRGEIICPKKYFNSIQPEATSIGQVYQILVNLWKIQQIDDPRRTFINCLLNIFHISWFIHVNIQSKFLQSNNYFIAFLNWQFIELNCLSFTNIISLEPIMLRGKWNDAGNWFHSNLSKLLQKLGNNQQNKTFW